MQKILARAGLASRREAEEWIRQGRVTINGDVATLGTRAAGNDQVKLDGRLVRQASTVRSATYLCHRSPGEGLTEPREGEERAVERIAEEPPQAGGTEEADKLAGTVIDEEELRDDRRAAEEIGVAVGQRSKKAAPRQAAGRHWNGYDSADSQAQDTKLDGRPESFEDARPEPVQPLGVDAMHEGEDQPNGNDDPDSDESVAGPRDLTAGAGRRRPPLRSSTMR